MHLIKRIALVIVVIFVFVLYLQSKQSKNQNFLQNQYALAQYPCRVDCGGGNYVDCGESCPRGGGGGGGGGPPCCDVGTCGDMSICGGGGGGPPPCSPGGTSCGACSVSCGGGTQTCGDGCSSYSQACNTQSCCVNSGPSAPQLSSPSDSSLAANTFPQTLTWHGVSWGTNCSGNNNTYTVYFDTGSSPVTVLCTVGSGTTSCDTPALTYNTQYYWKVSAGNGYSSATSATWSLWSPIPIYGWLYTEVDNVINRSTSASEGLISGYTVNLSGGATGSTTSQGTAITGYLANYIFFQDRGNNTYNIQLAVTPTGSVLYPGFTNPKTAVIAGGPVIADFPFITVTPTFAPGTPTPTPVGAPIIPSNTPTPSPNPLTPTVQPTPTSILPAPPANCQALPTPDLKTPAHQLCTNTKPTFSAYVRDPNGDNAWAHFYSNAYETFSRLGTPQIPPYPAGTYSQYVPDSYMLNSTGGYWWTAYTESSTCPRSADAPAWLISMDYSSPPQPTAPNCTLQSQDLVSGACTFSCIWPADPEADSSCADTSDYHPIFWTTPSGSGWDPGWIGNKLATNVVTGSDGQLLYSQLVARDSVNNVSAPSTYGGPFTCPQVIYSPTVTPGGPTLTPTVTPTPTNTPTPTITPTPTPGDWIQVQGGDTYQKSYNYPVPAGQNLITNLPGDNYNTGIGWSGAGSWNLGFGTLSTLNKKVGNSLSNTYNFSYFEESLKNKSLAVPNTTKVGTAENLDDSHSIYSYSGLGYYYLDTNFTPKTPVTIFLISGSLEIFQNFSIPAGDSVVFVVNGNIYVNSSVTKIPGLYISSQVFSVAYNTTAFELDGMVYANSLNLQRTVRNPNSPTYKFIYQPQYVIALLPYLGRSQVDWQEVKP